MRAHVFQHVPFEDIGCIRNWLEQNNARITYTRFYENARLPLPDDVDLLVIMGGPMSVNDEAQLPWLHDEKQFIRDAVEKGIPILGICLGAQLIASALGARIYKNAEKEIGWFNVQAVDTPANTFGFPRSFTALHWHGETFDLPPNAIRLAQSEACKNQAFQIGKNVIALQFHLEATQESVNGMTENCGNELVPSTFVQTAEELLKPGQHTYENINTLISTILNYLTGKNLL